jgi:hypothetical protein
VVAAFLPGDAVTLVLETVPLYVLYEASILLASVFERRDAARARAQAAEHPPQEHPPAPNAAAEPTVQERIDHVDRDLSD